MSIIDPPAIVRSVEENQKTAQDWHDQAIAADRARSDSSLRHAEALYMLQDKYLELGYESFGKYVFDNFGKSESWAKKLIQIHTKFVVSLGRSPEELQSIGFGKLGKLASIVDTDNADQILDDAKNMTQSEIGVKIKESKGLQENETKEGNGNSKLTFSGPPEAMEAIKTAIDLAKEEYVHGTSRDINKVLPFQALEVITSNYLVSSSIDSPKENLDNLMRKLEKIYSLKISYEKVDNE